MRRPFVVYTLERSRPRRVDPPAAGTVGELIRLVEPAKLRAVLVEFMAERASKSRRAR